VRQVAQEPRAPKALPQLAAQVPVDAAVPPESTQTALAAAAGVQK
jgi:hypothetical protein